MALERNARNAVAAPALARRERARGWSALLPGLWNFGRRKPLGAAGGVLMLVIVFLALFADQVAPYDPIEVNLGVPFSYTSAKHLLGLDELGRDVVSRIIYGARISLVVGLASVGLGTILGTLLGITSGYFGGYLDLLLQRVVDSIQAFPAIILALVIMAMLGSSLVNVIIAIGIVLIPLCTRVVRSTVLSVKENQYIEAARAIGCGDLRILAQHVLPNVTAPIIVVSTAWLGTAIIIEASLSFLGLGTPKPLPSWGGMLSEAAGKYLLLNAWLAFYPGFAISAAVLGVNFLGDALRDVWDPRLRGR